MIGYFCDGFAVEDESNAVKTRFIVLPHHYK
jgi:hypothetical protein